MKFSEIAADRWPELRAYLDTCLLPVTGLKGDEPPWIATEALELLRDWLDPLEGPFRGRTVTYPAAHYLGEGDETSRRAEELCRSLKSGGFRFVVVVAPRTIFTQPVPSADLVFGPAGVYRGTDVPGIPHSVDSRPRGDAMSEAVRLLWRTDASALNGNDRNGQP
jgi:23S rRNA (pseudouridine1915-N3)-methyltransferase